ncbi:TetR/AcrR family transcriptional regulator [Christensenellaceae bacterium OttesenSCG-928-M15]|nr:TetR/AcrR family transcriptional regulator [Christensenellaceae bacterium OttesenSCG-928-M15]
MKKDIKDAILYTARDLFNERGYQEVSMRNIADALNISVGNLTYHYKKKEDLIAAVYLERHKSYKKPGVPQNITELNQFFMRVLDDQQKNHYYFGNYDELLELCPKAAELQLVVMQDLFSAIKGAFTILQNEGIMRREAFTNQYDVIIQALLTICLYELPAPMYFGENAMQQKLMSLWSIVFAFLTEEGKKS